MKFLLLLALCACASLPPETAPTTATELRDAEKCAQVSPCIPIRADNQLYHDATIFVNGARVGDVPGNGNKTFWIRRSLLVEGDCLYARAYLRVPNVSLNAARECGSTFRLTIGVEGYLWVNPRDAR